MKKNKIFMLLVTVTAFLFLGKTQAGFNFSNQNSTVHVGSQASFIINREIGGMNGTLHLDDYDPDRITGASEIVFEKGVLENGYAGTTLSGKYTPYGNLGHDKVQLQGTPSNPHWFISQDGAVVPMITVQGGGNRVQGRPVFSSEILFDGDPSTKLSIEIQNKLSKDIELNNGVLDLGGDLSLADGVMIKGPGTVEFNEKTLYLGNCCESWDRVLRLKEARDIQFYSRQNLTGVWTFEGDGLINGHGSVLDVTGGGKIVVEPNSQLYINNAVIKGVGDLAGLGGFVFADVSSRIILSNVTIELDSSYATTIGNIYVDGSSTVIVKDHVWLFDQQGSLTVDGVVLWTDLAGAIVDGSSGIVFGAPEANHYSSVESGAVKMAVGGHDFDSLSNLVYENSDAIAHLQESSGGGTTLLPGETLTFDIDQTLDGGGKNVVFSHSEQPQFVVGAGVTVTLENIEFLRINENTFQMGAGSKIKVGPNVLFELSEDVVWRDKNIELVGEDNIFTIRGVGGRKRLDCSCSCANSDLAINLSGNTLLLQNIEFSGLHFCDGSRRLRTRERQGVPSGAIALGGNSIVHIEYSTPMNFIAQSNDNELRLRRNNVALKGRLLFGNMPENDLHIKFLLEDEGSTSPRVRFESAFALITSQDGWANLIFDDPYVEVYNETDSSFVLSDRALLQGNRLEILHSPIKQISRNIVIMPDVELTSDLDNAIEQEFLRFLWDSTRGVGTRRNSQRERVVLSAHKENYEITYKSRGNQRWTPDEADFEINNNSMKLSRAKHNIWLNRGTITDFGVSEDEPLSVTMVDGATLKQGGRSVAIKHGDEIRAQGRGNKIVVSNTFMINGKLLFADNSELTFEFDSDCYSRRSCPEVRFACDYEQVLAISKGSRLTFRGKGNVVFQDGYVLCFDGAVCSLQDSAELSFAPNAILSVTGSGKIFVDNKARLCVGSGQQLTLGLNALDSIELLVDRQGEVVVGGEVMLQGGAHEVDVMRYGKIVVKNDGLFEINGVLTRFTLRSGGTLEVNRGGLLRMGEREAPFIWDNRDGGFKPGGILGLGASDFAGQIQDVTVGPVSLLPKDFVSLFIDKRPEFTETVLFLDALGNRKICTRDGIVVDLLEDDLITGENVVTGAIMLVNDGEPFAITPQGERI
ncbi:hypothetical protein KKA53_01315 [Candidatus Dependentiae bacterium]|nr:hypothetical protein [Candidatus Dependentiae bacterium]